MSLANVDWWIQSYPEAKVDQKPMRKTFGTNARVVAEEIREEEIIELQNDRNCKQHLDLIL